MTEKEKIEMMETTLALIVSMEKGNIPKVIESLAIALVAMIDEAEDIVMESQQKVEFLQAHNEELEELLEQTELVVDEDSIPDECKQCSHFDELFEVIEPDENEPPEGFWN